MADNKLIPEASEPQVDLLESVSLDESTQMEIMEKYDAINTLVILSEKCKNKEELIEHIRILEHSCS